MHPLISVHVPKCAGTSFRKWIGSIYGSSSILYDYEDRPIDPTSRMNTDEKEFLREARGRRELPTNIKVVHGHFWIEKYAHVVGAARITFLRHPLDRTLSHYFYWQKTEPDGHALHTRFLSEGMDVLKFAEMPEISGLYRNYFFRHCDMSSFDFIGSFDAFEEDLMHLEKLLGVRGERARVNASPHRDYVDERARIIENDGLREALTSRLAEDIDFFDNQMFARQKLIRKLMFAPSEGSGAAR